MIQFDGGKLDMYNEGWFTLLEPVKDSNSYLSYFRVSAKVFEKEDLDGCRVQRGCEISIH